MKNHNSRPNGGRPNELVIYMSEYCCMYYDIDDRKIKVEGGNVSKSAQDLISRMSFLFDRKIKELLKDPKRISDLLNSMSEDDLTNMLLQYKLMVEKKLFERT